MLYINKADQQNIADLRAASDIVEEVSNLVTYLGFCAPGTIATSEAKFSILKIEQSGSALPIITTFKWATGICSFNLVWDDRATYEYKFKNF